MDFHTKAFIYIAIGSVLFVTAAAIGIIALPFLIPAAGLYLVARTGIFNEIGAKFDNWYLFRQAKMDVPISPNEIPNKFFEKIKDEDLNILVEELMEFEGFEEPPKPPRIANSLEGARYRDQLRTYVNNQPNLKGLPKFLINTLKSYEQTGKGTFEGKRQLTVEQVEEVSRAFYQTRLFPKLERALDDNARTLGCYPSEYKGDMPGLDYFIHTPLRWLAWQKTNVSLNNRFEHTHILAGTGAGKTQLIQYMISKDLEEDCTVIVIDNQRQMIPKLASLGYDMQLLSPHYPLALNLFDMPRSATTAPLLRYVLSGLMGAPLTAKQAIVFQFAVDLMLSVKGNIHTFHELLEGKEFDFSGLDETARKFFETEFYTKGQAGYESTRKEISWRVWTLLTNPTLRNMFASKDNKCALDLNRKLILIDTDIDLLQDYSGLFGRFFIAQLLQLAQQRFSGSHRPVYVYIDECYYYLDPNINSMLETARKAKIGLTLAHQYLGQITEPKVSAGLMSLTSTKFAAQLSPSDRYAMAQAMRIKPEYFDTLEPLEFALWQKSNETVTIKVPVGVIENMPQHPIPHDEMVQRYGRTAEPPPPPPPPMEEQSEW